MSQVAQAANELLRQVRLLELVARRNAGGRLLGDYQTSVRGNGLIFHETRPYVAGEPVRHIDWNITARLGEPHVKVHLEERQRDIVVAVDVSPSMHLGFQRKTKLELAIELAATLVVSAADSGDRVGHLVFADRVLTETRPRRGRGQLFRVLRSLIDHTEPWQRPVSMSDPRLVLHALGRYRRRRLVVFLISDFIDHDLPADLDYARVQHDISLLHVYDPVEFKRGPLVFNGRSPEGQEDGRPRATVRSDDGESLAEMQTFLRQHAARRRIAVDSWSTAEPVGIGLQRFFHRKRRQLARGAR